MDCRSLLPCGPLLRTGFPGESMYFFCAIVLPVCTGYTRHVLGMFGHAFRRPRGLLGGPGAGGRWLGVVWGTPLGRSALLDVLHVFDLIAFELLKS